jgi:multiple sugar transport system substrate-binding protein
VPARLAATYDIVVGTDGVSEEANAMASLRVVRAGLVTRRKLLAGGLALSSLVVAACSAAALPSPTAAPSQPAAATTARAAANATLSTTSGAPAAAASASAASAAAPTAAAQPAAQAAPQGATNAPVVPLWNSSTTSLPAEKAVIAQFAQQHPDISVQPVYVPESQYDQKADLLLAAGNAPSIFFPEATRCYRYYAAKGLILNLDPLISRDKYPLDDFFPNILAGCKFKGSTKALPKSSTPWVLYYNKTAFDKANVPYPTMDWRDPNWTWDKYLEAAKALTITANGRPTQYGAGSYFARDWMVGWAFGGWWFNHDWIDTGWITKFTAPDDPRVAPGEQYWSDMANKLHYSPTPAAIQSVQAASPDPFMTGHLATWFQSVGWMGQYSKITDFEWGIAAWPHASQDQFPTHQGAWKDQNAIFKNTRNPDGSWEFLKFVTSPEGQQTLLIQQEDPGTRRSLQQAWIDYWKQKMPKLTDQLKVATDAMSFDYLTPDNWGVNFSTINDKVLAPAIQKVTLGEQAAVDMIKEVTPTMDQAIADTLKTMGYVG